MPAAITCAPSNTWNSAAMPRKETASAITCALAGSWRSRKMPASRSGIEKIMSAVQHMKAVPSTKGVQPARVIAARSRAPKA